MAAIYIDYLNALDIEALAMTDDEILAAVEAGLVAQGNGQTVIEPRVHLEPDPAFRRPFQRAARLRRAARHGRRQDRRRLCRQLPARPALGIRHPQPVRSAHRHAAGHPRRHRHHRHAHRRGDRDRRQAPGAEELESARPYRRARHRLLERAPARPSLRFRRDPRAFAPAGKPRRLRRKAVGRSRQAGHGGRRLARLRRGRRHRRRGVAAAASRSRCSRPNGSSRARWSCPMAR